MGNIYQPKSDGNQNPNNPPKSGSNAYKEDKKIVLNVDVTNDIIQPLFDAIDLEKSQGASIIHVPKTIAKIKFLGTALVIDVPDNCKGFIKPTKRQIKNLKKHFCIDVELFD